MTDTDPIAGTWYRRRDVEQEFLVTVVNEREGVVELQHYDGDLEELDLNEWYDLELEVMPAPEDWSGSADNVDPDGLDGGESASRDRSPRFGDAQWDDTE